MKKLITLCMSLVMLCSVLCLPTSAAVAPYTNNFSSRTDLDDWQAYFAVGVGTVESEKFANHWQWKNGAVSRINDIVENEGTKYIASLTLKDVRVRNFELSVKYQKTGSDWPWAAVAIRQNFPGRFFLDDGLGIFVQDEGLATFWGADECKGPYEGSKINGYDKSAVHTMKITALNDLITVYIDGEKAMERSFPAFVREGYVSLVSVNNAVTFDDFSLTKLDNSGNPVAITKSTASTTSSGASNTTTTTSNTTTTTPANKNSTIADSSEEDPISSDENIDDSSDIDTSSDEDTDSSSKKDSSSDKVSLEDLEDDSSRGGNGWIFLIIGVVVVLATTGVCCCFFVFKKKK